MKRPDPIAADAARRAEARAALAQAQLAHLMALRHAIAVGVPFPELMAEVSSLAERAEAVFGDPPGTLSPYPRAAQ